MNARAAVYARLSTDRHDDKQGVAAQLEACRQKVAENGWDLVDEYVDPAESASRKDAVRPHYDRLVRDYAAGRFEVLVCWDLDRLTRQPRQLEDWIDAAEDRGLRVVTANGEADLSTDAGQMFARVKVTVARAETSAASRRLKANVAARKKAGRWHGGNPPYGYRPEGDARGRTLVPYEPEAALMREAAARVLAGDTLYGVVKDWAERGVVTGRASTKPRSDKTESGQHWRQGALRAKLLNRALLGEVPGTLDEDPKTKKRTRSPGVARWEPVLDADTFARLEAKLRDPSRNVARSPGVRSTKYTMAGGLTICGRCGHRMISNVHRGVAILFCSKNYGGSAACGSNRVEHDALEEYVLGATVAAVTASPRWAQRRSDADPERDRRVSVLDAEVAALRGKRDRVLDMYQEGLVDKRDRDARLAPLGSALAAAEEERERLLGQTEVADVLRDGTDWRSWTPAKRRALLSAVHGRIVVRPERSSPPHRRKDEPDEEYAGRRRTYMAGHLRERVDLPA